MYGAAHSVRIRPGFVPHDAPAGAAHQGAPPCADAGVPAAHTIEIQIARYESMSIDFILVVLIMLEHENRMVFICVTVSVYAVSGCFGVSVPARFPVRERTCECAEPAQENPVAVRGDAVCTARSTLVDRHSVYTLIRLGVARWGPK